MKVSEIDREFSFKIGDPRTDGGDGTIYDAVDRLNYIKAAYRRLSRITDQVMRQFQPNWNSMRKLYGGVIFNDPIHHVYGSSFTMPAYRKIDQVYVYFKTFSNKVYKGKATWIDPENYLNTKHEINSVYTPSYEKQLFYYSVINSEVVLLPQASKETGIYVLAEVLYLPDVEDLDFDSELSLNRQYLDLLLAIASSFAMIDVGRADKVQLFKADIMESLKIMAASAALDKQEFAQHA